MSDASLHVNQLKNWKMGWHRLFLDENLNGLLIDFEYFQYIPMLQLEIGSNH